MTDHEFADPQVVVCDIRMGKYRGVFGVMAEGGDEFPCARICFASWLLGPGVGMKFKGFPHDFKGGG